MVDKQQSPIALAIEQRGRKFVPFDVQGFFGLRGEDILKIDFRVPVAGEEDTAVIAAHDYAAKRAQGDAAPAAQDLDLLDSAKLVEVLHRCCFQHAEDAKPDAVRYPAFDGGPKWMRDNLTKDQIAALYNCLLEVKQAASPLRNTIDLPTVERLARACWVARETDVPEMVLADCDREFITQAFVLVAGILADAKGWAYETADNDADEPTEPDDAS